MVMAIQSKTSIAAVGGDEFKGARAPIVAVVSRLADLLDEETQQLEKNDVSNLGYFIDQKSRSLLDLSRALAAYENTSSVIGLDDELTRLRRSYEKNRSMLGIHLASVQEITEIIATAMQQAESDGTYNTRIAR